MDGFSNDPLMPDQQGIDAGKAIRMVIGIVLLAIGTVIAIYILISVFQMLDGNPPDIISKIASSDVLERTLKTSKETIEIPKKFFEISAYTISAGLLFIAAIIGVSFISGGVQLMNPDVKKWFKTLKDDIIKEMKKQESLGNNKTNDE